MTSYNNETLTFVTIAKENFYPLLPRWVVHTEGWEDIGRSMNESRVNYLAGRRNKAIEEALRRFPDTETIMLIDSYYTKQKNQIANLLKCYDGKSVLGGSTWVLGKQFRDNNHFWDTWTTPEASQYNLYDVARVRPAHLRVQGVGGVIVFPRLLWDMGARFKARKNWHRGLGCEMNGFCEEADSFGYPSLLCFDGLFEHPSGVPVMRQFAKKFLNYLPKGVFAD